MSRELLHNASIVNEGKIFEGFVVIEGDKISQVGEGQPPSEVIEGSSVVDLKGCLLLPGVIDDQVHFRDPGLTHKADIASESRAAVAGGVTSYMDMPNNKPQTTSVEALEAKYRHASEVSLANYSFYIGATNDNIEELRRVDYSATCGVKVFLGSSTGNMLVDNQSALERIFGDIPALVAIHSEDEAIIRANRARYTAEFGEDPPTYVHPLIRSSEACYASTARAVEMAERLGTRLHVLHLSTEREMALLSPAPIAQKRITAEVCVHHLWFTDADYATLGNRIKCNPAIKSEVDREALRNALLEGRLDVVATDHAPHLLSEKQGGCLKAASGMPLVQFSLTAMLEMARQGIFTVEQVVEKMCHAPAELFRIDRRGYIRPGYYADLTVVDTGASRVVTADEVVSKCGWSPFEGVTMHNRVVATWVNGNLVYDHGRFDNVPHSKRLMFKI